MSDAVGRSVRIKDQTFRVVGVFPKSSSALLSTDEQILSPYTTVQQYLTGTTYFNSMLVRATPAEDVPRVVRDIEAT